MMVNQHHHQRMKMSCITLGIILLGVGCRAFAPRTSFPVSPTRTRTCTGSRSTYTSTTTTTTTTTTTQLDIIPSRSNLKNLEWKNPTDDQVTHWLSKYGEVSRYYRRDVFSAGDWVRARRPTRFVENILSTFESGLIRQISFEVGILAMLSLSVVCYNYCLQFVPPVGMGGIVGRVLRYLPWLKLPLVPFNLAAASLGLLLTFRTNVSYQRWNEARTAWGRVINDSRSLARMACIWATSYQTTTTPTQSKQNLPLLLTRLGETICSFSRTLMNRTLPKQEDEKDFQLFCYTRLLSCNPLYAQRLLKANHRPTVALAELSSLLVQFNLHPLYQVQIEQMVSELCSSMGACERIFTSPVPTFYSRHTIRCLAVWLYLLPLALYETITAWNHLALVPVMVVLGAFMLGIEELANQMEEPFSILPMEKMCENSIRGPVMDQVQRSIESLQATPTTTTTTTTTLTTTTGSTWMEEPVPSRPPPQLPTTASAQAITDSVMRTDYRAPMIVTSNNSVGHNMESNNMASTTTHHNADNHPVAGMGGAGEAAPAADIYLGRGINGSVNGATQKTPKPGDNVFCI